MSQSINEKNANHYVSMIFTHQARMRCFFRKSIEPIVGTYKKNGITDAAVFSDDDEYNAVGNDDPDFDTTTREQILSRPAYLDEEYVAIPPTEEAIVGGNKKWKLPRFKNGSVLRCIITYDKIKIELLVEGEIDENKPNYVYYVKPENVSTDVGAQSGKYKVTAFDSVDLRNTTYTFTGDDVYTFYIVRHGQATHNLLKGIKQKLGSVLSGQKDTSLTPIGTDQAKRSGKEFAKLFVGQDKDDNIGLTPRFIFTSDLRRTRQTAQAFLNSLVDNTTNPDIAQQIIHNTQGHRWIVLPCTHELAFVDSGYCDGFQNPLPTPPENQMTCDVNDARCGITSHDYAINWDHYSKFYGSSTRSKLCRGCGAKHCRDTDMIKEAINIIQQQQQMKGVKFALGTKIRGGKTKRRHKNKKQKTRKSPTRNKVTRKKRNHKLHKRAKKSRKSKH